MSINAEMLDQADLTPREVQVFKLLCEGHADKTIAARLEISIKTVEHHIDHIYSKIGVQHQQLNARVASIATAVARGMIALTLKVLCWAVVGGLVYGDHELLREARVRTGTGTVRSGRRFD